MADFIDQVNNKFKNKVYISINPFVPKLKTNFEAHVFDKKELKKQEDYLKKKLNALKVKYKFGSINTAYKEWKLGHEREL